MRRACRNRPPGATSAGLNARQFGCPEKAMSEPYPRDMIGYGAQPPNARWPGEARIALQLVINYEEGAENAIFHGDPAAESFLSEWIGAQPTARPAQHEHGVALRIRQPRRVLAALPRLHLA